MRIKKKTKKKQREMQFIHHCTDHKFSYNMGLDARTLYLGVCEQHRPRTACASAQSDQRLFIRFLESIICKLAAGEISIFKLVSIAEETGLKHSLSKPPEDRFSHNEAHMIPNNLVFSGKIPKKKECASGFSSFCRHGRRHFFHTTQFTHISLTSFLWCIGKQCRTRSDPAERDI